MKKIGFSLLLLLVGGVIAMSGITSAVLTDEGDILGNTVLAGSLDVTVNGGNATLTNELNADNIKPDNTNVPLGTVNVANAGTLPGKLRISLENFRGSENGLLAPELAAGDSDGVQVDTTGYKSVDGDGELGSQIGLTIFVDTNKDGIKQWNETSLWSGEHIDLSDYYSLKEGVDIAADNNITLQPGDEMAIGVEVRWIDDTTNSWWGGYNGMSNNQAMSDTFVFDMTVGLDQL